MANPCMGSLDSDEKNKKKQTNTHDLQPQSRENAPVRRQNDGYLCVSICIHVCVDLNLESKPRPGKPKVHTKKKKKKRK